MDPLPTNTQESSGFRLRLDVTLLDELKEELGGEAESRSSALWLSNARGLVPRQRTQAQRCRYELASGLRIIFHRDARILEQRTAGMQMPECHRNT